MNRIKKHHLKPQWAIVIATYKRQERFFVCLSCLVGAIKQFASPIQLIIMDNDRNSQLYKSIKKFLGNNKLIHVQYVKDASSNQAELRNRALGHIENSIKHIFFLDSDIYISNMTISVLHEYLRINKSVIAIAPPLASYSGGAHKNARLEVGDSLVSGGTKLIMPNEYDYLIGKKKGLFIKSHMLRGAFIVNRRSLIRYYGPTPWLRIFKVWQNVPFFLTMNELKLKFGYLLEENIIALHDSREHQHTIRFNMKEWSAETIKSIILLFFRNRLWMKNQQQKNVRFITEMENVISKHTKHEKAKSIEVVIKIAEILSYKRQLIKTQLREIYIQIEDEQIRKAVKLLISHNLSDIFKVFSADYKKRI